MGLSCNTNPSLSLPSTRIIYTSENDNCWSWCVCVCWERKLLEFNQQRPLRHHCRGLQICLFNSTPSLTISVLRFSSSSSRICLSLCSSYSPSQRIALVHLSSAIPQSLLPGVNTSSLLRLEGNTIEVSTVANMAEPSTVVTEENAFEWVKNDKRRMLHVVYRVGDVDKTIKFYVECLGLKLLRKRNIPRRDIQMLFLDMDPKIPILLLNLLIIMESTSITLELVLDILALQLKM
ncbi:probable lactoylglutathione lyase, chloroplastic [Actinidia eriantha]|uniref:probable lactoylglutathione lyase, chloroplastic n=1 Tax=Actinidia eriantha TaxID=165200 RepID=UPI0025863C49|nr:probable lactoylglutathione lyase, chloroplastic [Actinidia eriantha]